MYSYLNVLSYTDVLDDVGVIEEHHPPQQRHLADHGGGDPALWRVDVDVEFLHRQEAPFPARLSGLVHFAVGAFSYFCQQLVAQRFTADVHDGLTKTQFNLN